MSLFEWLEIEWLRLNIWLREKRDNSGCSIRVVHEGEGRFRVLRSWDSRGKSIAEVEAEKRRMERESARRRRLDEFLTVEQRAAIEERRRNAREKRQEDSL